MEVRQLTDHVRVLAASPPFYIGPLAPNVYLVADGDEGALVDSGFADEASVQARIEYLRGLPGLRLRYIVLTHHHFDHASGAARLAEATGAQVLLHPDEAPFLRDWEADAPQDLEAPEGQEEWARRAREFRQEAARAAQGAAFLADGDVLRVGSLTLQAVHTPGHTMGSLCLLLREEGVLFTGDTALGLGTVAVSPPPHGDMALYLQSLERLKGLGASLMLPGHGPPVKEVGRKLQELVDHRLERERQVLSLLAQGKGTVMELVRAIYPELDRRILGMARRQVEAHLHKLMAEGRVVRQGEGAEARYVPA
ncbi:MAG: MBL fold metallo-hydrolase [Dehalococcoidia bacterium]|nr:MBL fold metallo-hydrolase [Dehalococcoidia bacterium]MDW8008050.1 MBL fold metallo-hydrolase [Chloroflexota bacterium]